MPQKIARAGILSRPPSNLGLVGYWPMDEGVGTKVGDFSGFGNVGSINGATWVDGKRGRALSFDGGDFVSVAHSENLNISNTLSISVWVKLNEITNRGIFEKTTNGTVNTQYLLFTEGGHFKFRLIKSAMNTIVSDVNVSPNRWYYVSATYDGTTMRMYVDGILQSETRTISSPIDTGTGESLIGSLGSGVYRMNGSIDDVRIYNRALSQSEISKLYTSGTAIRKQVSNSGLVGYWSMNEGRGNKATDSSGQGNTGTITGATWVDGKRGKALSFNGSSDGIDVGNPNSLANLTSDITVSAWAKPNSLESYFEKNIIISGRRTEIGQPYTLTISPTKIAMTFQTDNINNGVIGWATKVVNATNNLNEWAYFTVVRSGLNVIFYKNGQQVGVPQTFLASTIYPGNGMLIGRGFYGGNWYFNGLIDDVRIYNRALSATEIQNLYKQTEVKINSSQNDKLTSGLVGLWSFNGKDVSGTIAYDRSGNGNNGTINGATLDAGKVGQGMRFDGVDDNVNIGDQPSLDISGNSSLTVSAWVKSSDANVHSYKTFFNKYSWTQGKGYLFWIYEGDLILTLNQNQYIVRKDFTNYLDGTWHFVAGVKDSTNPMRLYIDGREVSSYSRQDNGGDINSPAGLVAKIGERTSTGEGASRMSGSIDEVRVYNRALSADEIKQLFLIGK